MSATNNMMVTTGLDFGSVNLGSDATESIALSSNGNCTSLTISETAGEDADAFSVVDTDCGASLNTSSCAIDVEFVPLGVGAHNATINIATTGCDINVSGSGPDDLDVTLTGIGVGDGVTPEPPELVYPADGETGLPTSLTLIWKEAVEPQGDEVTYTVFICTVETFEGCEGQEVASSVTRTDFLALGALGGSGLLLAGVFLPIRRHAGRQILPALIALATLWMILSCSGSSDSGDGNGTGSDEGRTPGDGEVGFEVSGLDPATTYYWTVAVRDPEGNAEEAQSASFTTE